METYQQMKERHHASFRKVMDTPEVFFAFDQKQYDKGMEALVQTEGWDGTLAHGLGGMYGTTRAFDDLVRLTREHRLELRKAMDDHGFAVDAIYREMVNHEFAYGYDGFSDVWEALNWEVGPEAYDEVNDTYTRDVRHIVTNEPLPQSLCDAYDEARRRYWRACEENGWW